VYTGRRLLTFRRTTLLLSSGLKTEPKKSSKQNAVYWLLALLNPSTVMVEAVESFESLVYFHQATSPPPKDGIIQIRRHERSNQNFRTNK
jgi:hypothetical protein